MDGHICSQNILELLRMLVYVSIIQILINYFALLNKQDSYTFSSTQYLCLVDNVVKQFKGQLQRKYSMYMETKHARKAYDICHNGQRKFGKYASAVCRGTKKIWFLKIYRNTLAVLP